MATVKEKLTLLKTFWSGYQTFQRTGKTPHESWLAMRRLFVETNGWFNDIFQFLYGFNKPYKPVQALEGSVLKGFTNRDVHEAVHRLKQDGYYVFPQRIKDKYLDSLVQFALETPAVLQYDDANAKPQRQDAQDSLTGIAAEESAGQNASAYFKLGHAVKTTDVRFDPKHLIATNYRFPEPAVLNNPTVQQLMADPVVISVAQQYIKSLVIFTTVGMWWTTPYGCNKPSSALAQQYHFDMDRIKFIKFFLYLTDVGSADGPHCYVRGSCQRKPQALRRDGRFQDEEIQANYDASDLVEFIAPKGTLIADDTRGFHKAKMPTGGNRLILEFELASCLFGQTYPKSTLEVKSSELQKAIKQDPVIWSNFGITDQHAGICEKVLVG